MWLGAGKGDLSLWAHTNVQPVASIGSHTTQIQPGCFSRKRLNPYPSRCAVIGTGHNRLAVGSPQRAEEIAVDRACDVLSVALQPIHHIDVLIVAIVAVPRINIGHMVAI